MVNRIFATAILSLLNLFMLDTMPQWGIQWVSKKWNFPKLPFPLSIWWPRPCSSPSCHSKPPSLRSYFRRYYFQPSHTTSFSFGRWYPFIYLRVTHTLKSQNSLGSKPQAQLATRHFHLNAWKAYQSYQKKIYLEFFWSLPNYQSQTLKVILSSLPSPLLLLCK